MVPPIGSTVDVENATYTNTIGAVELKTVWTDPEFDPSLHAFYYARVLEIPTPRWTTIQAKKLGIAPPDVVAATIQERAWGSPIWYTPSAEARKSAKPGITVADLKKQGRRGTQRRPAQGADRGEVGLGAEHGDRRQVHDRLRRPGQGRSDASRSRPSEPGYVTQRFPADQGQFQVRYVGKDRAAEPDRRSGRGQLSRRLPDLHDRQREDRHRHSSARRSRSAVYKIGDKYLGARSNEFGYANYEIIPAVASWLDP